MKKTNTIELFKIKTNQFTNLKYQYIWEGIANN